MPVIASYKRSAFGRLLGWLSSLSAMQLGSQSIRAALESAGISPSDVDWVVGGQVLQAGQGQNPIRQSESPWV
jgi:acetyl-CoA C-acetyltransferase